MHSMIETPELRMSQGSVVGETPEIQKIYQIIQTAARTNNPVLIVGEAGTGKEVIARAIHSTGSRRHLSFPSLDCANLRTGDLGRQLLGFGEDLGSVSHTDRGTLFLDRIIDMSLDQQGTLLRAIQQAESFSRVVPAKNEVRLIAASTRDIRSSVAEGTFRRDLYFRLNALTLRVPPLRERRRDIPLLAASFLSQFSCSLGREYRFSDEALRALLTYDWPGNVRELENCVERASCSSLGPIINLLDLPTSVSGATATTTVHFPNVRVVPLTSLEKRIIQDALVQVARAKPHPPNVLAIGNTTLYRKLRQYEVEGQ